MQVGKSPTAIFIDTHARRIAHALLVNAIVLHIEKLMPPVNNVSATTMTTASLVAPVVPKYRQDLDLLSRLQLHPEARQHVRQHTCHASVALHAQAASI